MIEAKQRWNLGWANECLEFFKRLDQCRAAGHKVGERNLDETHHGYNRLFWCDACEYEFHVDSSG